MRSCWQTSSTGPFFLPVIKLLLRMAKTTMTMRMPTGQSTKRPRLLCRYMNKLTQKDAICEWGSGVVEGSAQRNLIELYIHRIIDLELSLERGVRLYKFR
ncbi:hypothetical protein L218DRAFT_579206 [Marasmius fiardii PR-910]|nr:hypothetical protein L218DRAFT_579206 [Marasmius fiardii PR-910]